jgi:hypothetical protein
MAAQRINRYRHTSAMLRIELAWRSIPATLVLLHPSNLSRRREYPIRLPENKAASRDPSGLFDRRPRVHRLGSELNHGIDEKAS